MINHIFYLIHKEPKVTSSGRSHCPISPKTQMYSNNDMIQKNKQQILTFDRRGQSLFGFEDELIIIIVAEPFSF